MVVDLGFGGVDKFSRHFEIVAKSNLLLKSIIK